MIALNQPPKFKPGKILSTSLCLKAIENAGQNVWTFVARHLSCDWGVVDQEDAEANNDALRDGSRLLSAYHLDDEAKTKIWIITEAADDHGVRESTTLLLPEEY